MYAIGLNRYGGPEVLEVVELPDPHPGPGEVRIRVRAAAINPTDVMLRDGSHGRRYEGVPPPYVPGMDVAGTIDEIGPGAGLTVGSDVVGIVGPDGSHGAYSQYVCLPVASVTAMPKGVGFAAAASFLMNALTVREALDRLSLAPGASLLVTGAAGAVGAYAVALGADEGLRVLALAAPADAELLRAAELIPRGDGTAEGVAERVRRAVPSGVDGVIDGAGFYGAIAPAVRDGGTIIILRPRRATDLGRGVRTQFVTVRDRATDQAAIARLRGQVESGLLGLRVAATYPAREAVAAHRRFDQGGLRGRIVLTFDD